MKYLSIETIFKDKEICYSKKKILRLAKGRKRITWEGIRKLNIPQLDKCYIGSSFLLQNNPHLYRLFAVDGGIVVTRLSYNKTFIKQYFIYFEDIGEAIRNGFLRWEI